MQLTVHTPQVLGHSFMTARGLRSHSPLSCQMAHLVRGEGEGERCAVRGDGEGKR